MNITTFSHFFAGYSGSILLLTFNETFFKYLFCLYLVSLVKLGLVC